MKRQSYIHQADQHPGAIYQGPRKHSGWTSGWADQLAGLPQITDAEARFMADERNEQHPRYAEIAAKMARIAEIVRSAALAKSRDY